MKKFLLMLFVMSSFTAFSQDSEFSFHCRRDQQEYAACKVSCRSDAKVCRQIVKASKRSGEYTRAKASQEKDQCMYEKMDCLEVCEDLYPEWRQVDAPCFW